MSGIQSKAGNTRPLRTFALALVVAGALSACGNQVGTEHGGSVQEQRAELLSRPSLEEIEARYNEMGARIRDTLTAEFPWMRWKQENDGTKSFCGEFEAFSDHASSRRLGMWVAVGNIPDAQWPRAKQIALDIAREYGFTTPTVQSDRPGSHHMVVVGQYRSTFDLGTQLDTVMTTGTGCHLPQAVKDNPPPEETD